MITAAALSLLLWAPGQEAAASASSSPAAGSGASSFLGRPGATTLVGGLVAVAAGTVVAGLGAAAGFQHATDSDALDEAVQDYVETPNRETAGDVEQLRLRLGTARSREALAQLQALTVVGGATAMGVGWAVAALGAWRLTSEETP
jgi:hypothetical protein